MATTLDKWNTAKPLRFNEAKSRMLTLMKNRDRYETVQERTGVPWQLIMCLHEREGGGDIDTYLGNGEPLYQVTNLVPAGRGPFDNFEDGAVDALVHEGFNKIKSWPIETMLDCAERFNGLGYRHKGVPSPYIWAGTDQYTSGKYVSDGKYSSSAVDKQLGVAIMLKALISLGSLVLGGNNSSGTGVTVPHTTTTTNFIGAIIGAAVTALGTQSYGPDAIHMLACFGGPVTVIASILNQLHVTGGSNVNTIDQIVALTEKVTQMAAELDAAKAVAPIVASTSPVAPPTTAQAPEDDDINPEDALAMVIKLIGVVKGL